MIKRKMFLGADPLIFKNAEALRNHMTPGEMLLWAQLKGSQLAQNSEGNIHWVFILQIFIVISTKSSLS